MTSETQPTLQIAITSTTETLVNASPRTSQTGGITLKTLVIQHKVIVMAGKTVR